jgi:hypothetical protein
MLDRILIGALAGAVATVPQSAAVWGLKAAGVYRRTPPPEKVSREMTEAVLGPDAFPEQWFTPMMLAQHVGFGAAAGAAFGALTGVVRPTVVAGVLVGLAIWKASYDGWIPALRIMPPAEKDEEGRQVALVVAHVAYGLALGVIVDRFTSKR